MDRGPKTSGPAPVPEPRPADPRDGARPATPTTLAYCGICREAFEYESTDPHTDIRCPLCGFRHGEL